jgi:hypothetical protein
MNRKLESLPPGCTATDDVGNVLWLATDWVIDEASSKGFEMPFSLELSDVDDSRIFMERVTLSQVGIEFESLMSKPRPIPIPFACCLTDKNGRQHTRTFSVEDILAKLNADWESNNPLLQSVTLGPEYTMRSWDVIRAIRTLLRDATTIANPIGPFSVQLNDDNDHLDHFYLTAEIFKDDDGRFRISDKLWEYYGIACGAQVTVTLTYGKEVHSTTIWATKHRVL